MSLLSWKDLESKYIIYYAMNLDTNRETCSSRICDSDFNLFVMLAMLLYFDGTQLGVESLGGIPLSLHSTNHNIDIPDTRTNPTLKC